jgi:hypothetical protein
MTGTAQGRTAALLDVLAGLEARSGAPSSTRIAAE